MFRSKIENRSKFLADVDAYIRDHSPVSLEDLIQSMQELGYDCTPRMVRPILKESGLTVRSVHGRWFWGMWDDEVDDDDVDEEVFFHKSQVISSITLQSGDKVSFDLVKFKGKYQARQVVYVTTN